MVSLHAYVEHPRDFGINDYEITLGRYDLDNPDDTSDYTDIISTLKSFDRSTLSAKQQITLDELLMYIENELEYSDLYSLIHSFRQLQVFMSSCHFFLLNTHLQKRRILTNILSFYVS